MIYRPIDSNKSNARLPAFFRQRRTLILMALLLVLMIAAFPTFAQEETIEIPTDVIFTETNVWINVFAPIAAIGIGITVALAVLGYLGKMIVGAFKH